MPTSPSTLPTFSLDRLIAEGENFRPIFGDIDSPRWNLWFEPTDSWPFFLYLRKTQRHFPLESKACPTLEIASITGKAEPGRRTPYGSGRFWALTEALRHAFPARRIYIENVLNTRLARSFWRRGWNMLGALDQVEKTPCFYLPPLDDVGKES